MQPRRASGADRDASATYTSYGSGRRQEPASNSSSNDGEDDGAGPETGSTQHHTAGRARGREGRQRNEEGDLHKVALEEFFQLPLCCRISQVADVETATFGGAGKDSFVGSFGGLVSQRGIGQSVGNVSDGSGGSVSNFLHDGRHGD